VPTEFGEAASEMIGGGKGVGRGAATEAVATMISNPANANGRAAPRISRDFNYVLPTLRVSRPDFAQMIRRRLSQRSDVFD